LSEINNEDLGESIWFHAWKVNHGSHFLNRTNIKECYVVGFGQT